MTGIRIVLINGNEATVNLAIQTTGLDRPAPDPAPVVAASSLAYDFETATVVSVADDDRLNIQLQNGQTETIRLLDVVFSLSY